MAAEEKMLELMYPYRKSALARERAGAQMTSGTARLLRRLLTWLPQARELQLSPVSPARRGR